jgi:hypothetical protein
MALPAGWIERDDLLRAVRSVGLRVTTHQLLRWRNAGLLPAPKRVGHGRGRGTTVHYPPIATLQVTALAAALKAQRNLDEAGWAIWVFGFPVTDFARRLLVTELREGASAYRELLRQIERGEGLAALLRTRAEPVATLRSLAGNEIATILQYLGELRLGTLDGTTYTDDQFALIQETLSEAFDQSRTDRGVRFLDHPDLPRPPELRQASETFARTQSLPALRQRLQQLDDPRLCQARDEAQALTTRMAEALGVPVPVLSRSMYLTYLGVRFLNAQAATELITFLQQLGWTTPPPSPLVQLLRRARGASPSTPTP